MAVLSVLVALPWLAGVAAVAFALLWRRRRHVSAAVAAVLWGLYLPYEYLMYLRIWCSGECNIRVDLLLIYPLLLIVSVVAIFSKPRDRHRRK
jgi:hypothetical protein